MDLDSGEPCAICWAVAPAQTMPFHRMWHDELDLGELRLFRPGGLDEEVRDMVRTVAAIKGVPEPQATAHFVASLRERLAAEALDMAVEEDGAPRSSEAWAAREAAVPAGTDHRSDTLHRLARAGAAVAAMFLVATGTELVSHLRNTDQSSISGHPETILPHPH